MTASSASGRASATTGIVLAGGRSSRFRGGSSGASKLDEDLAGATVLDRTIAALAGLVDEVVVVGRSAPVVGQSASQVGRSAPQVPVPARIRYLEDREPHAGPLAGLLVGLEAAGGRTVVVAGGDMPLLRADVLRLLVARLAGLPLHDAAVLASGADLRPLPLALRRKAARAAAGAALQAGQRSLFAFLGRLTVAVVPEATWRALDPGGNTTRDIDTAADLEAVRGAWPSAEQGGFTE